MRQLHGIFSSNGDRNRERLRKLSHMAFMLYLGMSAGERRKTGDLATYDRACEELYRQKYQHEKQFIKKSKHSFYFPKEIDKSNPMQNNINYAYYVLKQPYKKIFEKFYTK